MDPAVAGHGRRTGSGTCLGQRLVQGEGSDRLAAEGRRAAGKTDHRLDVRGEVATVGDQLRLVTADLHLEVAQGDVDQPGVPGEGHGAVQWDVGVVSLDPGSGRVGGELEGTVLGLGSAGEPDAVEVPVTTGDGAGEVVTERLLDTPGQGALRNRGDLPGTGCSPLFGNDRFCRSRRHDARQGDRSDQGQRGDDNGDRGDAQ